ncbi:hypothetical protein [Jannaschia sp. R86511]|uniref:hypothetical protein n=1 Tax=Jannaschia sp. R86511 TaxID=3093853 RepID=UPI0036D40A8F
MEEPFVEPQLRVVREVVSSVLGRDRHGGPQTLDRVVGEAAGRLLGSGPDNGRTGTLQAAAHLVQRGDEPGARLLLRTAFRVAPDPAVAEAARRLRPVGALRRLTVVAVAVTSCVGLLFGGLVVAVLAGAEAVASGLLLGSFVPILAARLAWIRFIRLPGLTLQESQVWRALGVLRRGDVSDLAVLGNGRLRGAMTDLNSPRGQRLPSAFGRPDVSGWVGLAGVTGAVLCLIAGSTFPGLPPGAFLAAMPIGAAVAAVAVRAALIRARARTEHYLEP